MATPNAEKKLVGAGLLAGKGMDFDYTKEEDIKAVNRELGHCVVFQAENRIMIPI